MMTNAKAEERRHQTLVCEKKRNLKIMQCGTASNSTYLLHLVRLPRPMDGAQSHSDLVLQ